MDLIEYHHRSTPFKHLVIREGRGLCESEAESIPKKIQVFITLVVFQGRGREADDEDPGTHGSQAVGNARVLKCNTQVRGKQRENTLEEAATRLFLNCQLECLKLRG